MAFFKQNKEKMENFLLEEQKRGDSHLQTIKEDVNNKLKLYKGEIPNVTKEDNALEGGSEYKMTDIKRSVAWLTASVSKALTSSIKTITIKPKNYGNSEVAKKYQNLINKQLYDKKDYFDVIRKAVKTSAREGYAVIRVYWDFNYIKHNFKTVKEVPEHLLEQEQEEAKKGVINDKENSVEKDDLEIVDASQNDDGTYNFTIGEYQITKERPEFELIDKTEFVYDPDGTKLKFEENDCNFCIQKHTYTYSELRREELFDQDKVEELIQNKVAEESNGEKYNAVNRKEPEEESYYPDIDDEEFARTKVIIYEHFTKMDVDKDGETENVRFFYEKGSSTILAKQKNPYPEEMFPFLIIPYDTDIGTMYKESITSELEDVQINRTAIMRLMIGNLSYMINKFLLFQKGSVDSTNEERILKRAMGGYAEIDDLSNFQEIDSQGFPGEVMSLFNLLGQQSFQNSGISSKPQGLVSGSNRTASGINQVTSMASLRTWEKTENYKKNLIKPLAYAFKKLDEKNLDSIDFRDNNEEFKQMNSSELSIEVDIYISVYNPSEVQEKTQRLLQLLNTLQASIKAGQLPPSIMVDIIDRLLEIWEMPVMRNVLEQAKKEAEQMQQKQQKIKEAEMAQKENKEATEELQKEEELNEKQQKEMDNLLNYVKSLDSQERQKILDSLPGILQQKQQREQQQEGKNE